MPSHITDVPALNVTVSCFTSLLRRNFSAFKRLNQYAVQSLRGLTSPASESLTLETSACVCLCVCELCLSHPTNVFFFEMVYCQNNERFLSYTLMMRWRSDTEKDAFVKSGYHVLLCEECSHDYEQQPYKATTTVGASPFLNPNLMEAVKTDHIMDSEDL